MQMATLRAFSCQWSVFAWTSTQDSHLQHLLQRSSLPQPITCCAQLIRLTVLRKVGIPGSMRLPCLYLTVPVLPQPFSTLTAWGYKAD